MDRRKNYFIGLDTETCNGIMNGDKLDLASSLVYDIGWAIVDKKGNVYATRSYVVDEIFLGCFDYMKSAYYCAKIPNYIRELAEGTRKIATIYEIREQLKLGKTILYIGVNNHPEALAALSIDKNVILVDKSNPIIPEKLKSVAVISQTTLSDEEVEPIINKIKSIYSDAFIIEGICHASSERQNALKTINEEFDAIFVVGGENSNNSKTLFNLAKTLYPNKVIKLIQNASQIKEKDLLGLNHIVISSGASTPKEIIEEIKAKLLN